MVGWWRSPPPRRFSQTPATHAPPRSCGARWCTDGESTVAKFRLTWLLVLVGALSCSRHDPPAEAVTLATTTSTQDSGLLDVLVPLFQSRTGIEVKVVAVGTGQALQLGRRGDAD